MYISLVAKADHRLSLLAMICGRKNIFGYNQYYKFQKYVGFVRYYYWRFILDEMFLQKHLQILEYEN